MSSLTDPLGPDLTATLRALKLGKLTATLPERLTLARQQNMPHADFLQLILSDEVARREAGSIALRAKNAGLDLGRPAFSGQRNWSYFMLHAASSGTRRELPAESGSRALSGGESDYTGARYSVRRLAVLSPESGKRCGGPARLSGTR